MYISINIINHKLLNSNNSESINRNPIFIANIYNDISFIFKIVNFAFVQIFFEISKIRFIRVKISKESSIFKYNIFQFLMKCFQHKKIYKHLYYLKDSINLMNLKLF